MSELIKKVLSMMEEDLSETPDLQKIAEDLKVSRYVLSRKFKEYTGESFTTYLQRRRVSEGAKAIQMTQERILDVAISYGYGSQEAFHRGHQKLFKGPPRSTKKHHSLLFKRSALELSPVKNLKWKKVSRNAEVVYATGREFTYEEFDQINEFWGDFHQAHPDYKGKTYGLSLPTVHQGVESFFYLIGVTKSLGLKGEVKIQIPQKDYIVFIHRGPAQDLMRTFNTIWGTWVFDHPEFEIDGMDFEAYPAGYDPLSVQAQCEIYLPLK